MYKSFRCHEKAVNNCQIFLKFPLRRNQFQYFFFNILYISEVYSSLKAAQGGSQVQTSSKGASWQDRIPSGKLGRRAAVLALDHFPTSCVDFLPMKAGGNVGWRQKDTISPWCSLDQEVRTAFHLSPVELELA